LKRLSRDQVNLEDRELSLGGHQTKTGRPRTATIHPTLAKWLKKYRGPICPTTNPNREIAIIRKTAGLKGPWVADILRHTSASHQLRATGTFAEVALALGNSESMLRTHYVGRVSTSESRTFYSILPGTK
jgi:integrase